MHGRIYRVLVCATDELLKKPLSRPFRPVFIFKHPASVFDSDRPSREATASSFFTCDSWLTIFFSSKYTIYVTQTRPVTRLSLLSRQKIAISNTFYAGHQLHITVEQKLGWNGCYYKIFLSLCLVLRQIQAAFLKNQH